MKLIRIKHIRCNEYDGTTTYAWAPDEFSDQEIKEKLKSAQKQYLEAVENAKKSEPPNDFQPYGKPPYERWPDKTVAQINAEWEAKRPAWEEWKQSLQKNLYRFLDFLKEQGFASLWEVGCDDYEVDWGHRHGVRIDYSETNVDTTNTVAHTAGTRNDDDDF